MAFRRFGGLNYSSSNNIVHSTFSNTSNLTITNQLGNEQSNIAVTSNLDMNTNNLFNTGTVSFQTGYINSSPYTNLAGDSQTNVLTLDNTVSTDATSFGGMVFKNATGSTFWFYTGSGPGGKEIAIHNQTISTSSGSLSLNVPSNQTVFIDPVLTVPTITTRAGTDLTLTTGSSSDNIYIDRDIYVDASINATGNFIFNGPVDVSGNLHVTGGTATFQRVIAEGDASFNRGVDVSGLFRVTNDNAAFHHNVDVSGLLRVSGGATFLSGVYVMDGATFRGGIDVLEGVTLRGGLDVLEGVTLRGGLDVSGGVSLRNGLDVLGGVTFRGRLDVSEGVLFRDGVDVLAGVTLRGGVDVSGLGAFRNGVDVSGGATFRSGIDTDSLRVSGQTTINDDLDVIGDSTFHSGVDVSGGVTLRSNMDTFGIVTFHNQPPNCEVQPTGPYQLTNRDYVVNAIQSVISSGSNVGLDNTWTGTNTFENYVEISGVSGFFNANCDSSFQRVIVNGDASFNRGLDVSGVAVFGRVIANGDASFNGGLDVSGVSTFGRVIANGDASFNGKMDVSGVSTFGRVVANRDASFNGMLDVSGNFLVTGGTATFGRVIANGDASFNGGLDVSSALRVTNGNVAFNNALDVSGVATFNRIIANSDASFNGGLDVSGALRVINGNVVFNNALDVSGVATFGRVITNGDVSFNAGMDVRGGATFRGNVDAFGIVTFHNAPPTCGTDPSFDTQLANKQYVDKQISSGGAGTLLSSANEWTNTNEFQQEVTVTGNSGFKVTTGVATFGRVIAGGDVSFNSAADVSGNLRVTGGTASFQRVIVDGDASFNNAVDVSGNLRVTGGTAIFGRVIVGGDASFNSAVGITGLTRITNGTLTTNATSGALVVSGGVGVGGGVYVNSGSNFNANLHTSTLSVGSDAKIGTTINSPNGILWVDATSAMPKTTIQTGNFYVASDASIGGVFRVNKSLRIGQGATIDASGLTITAGGMTVSGDASLNNKLTVTQSGTFNSTLSVAGVGTFSNGTESGSTATGALTVAGGVGIAKNLNVGGKINGYWYGGYDAQTLSDFPVGTIYDLSDNVFSMLTGLTVFSTKSPINGVDSTMAVLNFHAARDSSNSLVNGDISPVQASVWQLTGSIYNNGNPNGDALITVNVFLNSEPMIPQTTTPLATAISNCNNNEDIGIVFPLKNVDSGGTAFPSKSSWSYIRFRDGAQRTEYYFNRTVYLKPNNNLKNLQIAIKMTDKDTDTAQLSCSIVRIA